MIILPDGSTIRQVVSEYSLDTDKGMYVARIEHKGITYVVHFYNNFWA